jgi:hypothetical protein
MALDCSNPQFGYTQGPGGWYLKADRSGPYALDSTCVGHLIAPTTGTSAYSPATVGTTDSTIVAAGTASKFLDLINVSATATICINFGAAAATITGSQCAAGEITLPPLFHRSWESNFVPTDAVHAIASAAATPATVGAD